MPRNKATFNAYVTTPLVTVSIPRCYHSENAFGTADAIGREEALPRIHDLKDRRDPRQHAVRVRSRSPVLPGVREGPARSTETRIYQNDISCRQAAAPMTSPISWTRSHGSTNLPRRSSLRTPEISYSDSEEVRPATRDELMHYGTKRHSVVNTAWGPGKDPSVN